MLAILLLFGITIFPLAGFAQSGTAMDVGGTTFYDLGGTSGTRQSTGNVDFYNFSNGTSATKQSVGNMDFYSGNTPAVNGTTQSIGGMTFGNWDNGTTSTSQSIGGTISTTSVMDEAASASDAGVRCLGVVTELTELNGWVRSTDSGCVIKENHRICRRRNSKCFTSSR